MTTLVGKIDEKDPLKDICIIEIGANILRRGGLVAFTTETVYGLGANALDYTAVKKIFKAKGRPSDNPLIVHISDISELESICINISDDVLKLAKRFWPGALTMILNKTNIVPLQTSGGLSTIAVRVPSNLLARLLIQKAGVPIAAPSANISGKPSPTSAKHVFSDLNGKIDMILDGGTCGIGIESTIIDMTVDIPEILRPGAVTKYMIELCLKKDIINNFDTNDKISGPKAPGMKYAHYSPNADLTIIRGDLDKIVLNIKKLSGDTKKKVGILATEQTFNLYSDKYFVLNLGDRTDLTSIEHNLFDMLRKFDENGIEVVFAEGFFEDDNCIAVMNRLKKAAAYKIIDV